MSVSVSLRARWIKKKRERERDRKVQENSGDHLRSSGDLRRGREIERE